MRLLCMQRMSAQNEAAQEKVPSLVSCLLNTSHVPQGSTLEFHLTRHHAVLSLKERERQDGREDVSRVQSTVVRCISPACQIVVRSVLF